MNTESDSSPQNQDVPPASARIGQVCDRCRAKKIKCNGAVPSCGSCAAAGVACEVSATLRRKTKIRGFSNNEEALIRSLRTENTELREKLRLEMETNKALRDELERQSQQQSQVRPRKLTRTVHQTSSRVTDSPLHATSSDAGGSLPDKSIYMIKHMGRLVHDEAGTGRFAGSTTGVHFVLRVEEACMQSSLNYTTRFPESSFSLYLLHSSTAGGVDLSEVCLAALAGGYPSPSVFLEEVRRLFPYPASYYINQTDNFIRQWESFCPVIVRKQFISDLRQLLHQVHEQPQVRELDYITLQMLVLLLAINEVGDGLDDPSADEAHVFAKKHMDLAFSLLARVASQGNLKALQSLILFSFYVQISGQCLWMVQLNGLMVRVAQSLGLHRHDRRFKHCAGEVELRRRMWWWIYTFDKMTSIVHGLPRLISDTDVDNDMPTDCNLEDTTVLSLSHPLPGEITSIFFFNQYILLGKKFSAILEQLYTTTARRGGAEKIVRLDRDLRVWNHAFNAYPHVNTFEIGSFSRRPFEENYDEGHAFINAWLQLLANIAMVLIHRPGLTFDASTPEFGTSLKACVASCTAIIELLCDKSLGWWLRNKCPAGPAVVFQCALMHVYMHCSPVISTPYGSPSCTGSRSVITKALTILGSYLPDPDSAPGKYVKSTRIGPIQDGIDTLRRLESALPYEMQLQDLAQLPQGEVGGNQSHQSAQGATATPNIEIWNTNSLESLNNFDFDWMFEDISPFPNLT